MTMMSMTMTMTMTMTMMMMMTMTMTITMTMTREHVMSPCRENHGSLSPLRHQLLSITFHCIALNYIVNYSALHYITLNCIALNYIVNYCALHYIRNRYYTCQMKYWDRLWCYFLWITAPRKIQHNSILFFGICGQHIALGNVYQVPSHFPAWNSRDLILGFQPPPVMNECKFLFSCW